MESREKSVLACLFYPYFLQLIYSIHYTPNDMCENMYILHKYSIYLFFLDVFNLVVMIHSSFMHQSKINDIIKKLTRYYNTHTHQHSPTQLFLFSLNSSVFFCFALI